MCMTEVFEQAREPDFLETRMEGMALLLKELELQIETRLRESERRQEEIRRQVYLLEAEMKNVKAGDPGLVNSVRSRLFSAINSLEREYRSERIQAWKDVAPLRIKRQELATEIDARRRLLSVE